MFLVRCQGLALLVPRSSLVPSVRTMSGPYSLKNRLNPNTAVKWVNALSAEERQLVFVALQKKQAEEVARNAKKKLGLPEEIEPETPAVKRPSNVELYRIGLHQGLPFVGFGFLDNFIMIVAGESIETFLGASLVISTMAAAALGNTISDVFGIGSAWYVEYWLARLGMGALPPLTVEQLEMPSSRIAANGGRALGVTIGCLLGMFPLLFFESPKSKKEKEAAAAEVEDVQVSVA